MTSSWPYEAFPDGFVYSSDGVAIGQCVCYQVNKTADGRMTMDLSIKPPEISLRTATNNPGGTMQPQTAEIKQALSRALKAEKAERKRLKREKRAKRRRDELHVTALAALEEIATDHSADAGARVAAAHQILERVA